MKLPDTPEEEEIPEITEIDGEGRWCTLCLSNRHVDELQTFVGNKKNQIWIGSVVNHWKPGILLWTIGDLVHDPLRGAQSANISASLVHH